MTSRPLIEGTQAVIATTHYLGTTIGWEILRRGGNAVDAAAAAAFALQVAEPHLCGPGGEAILQVYDARTRKVHVLGGQGAAPGNATIDHYRGLGLTLVPGSGLLAATVPAAFDAWILALQNFGTMTLEDVLAPATALAEAGISLLPQTRNAIAGLAELFRDEWTSSAAIYLPRGAPPPSGQRFSNRDMAVTFRRLIAAEKDARRKSREDALEAVRAAFYEGFVADAIDRFCRTAEVMDTSGRRNRGVMTGDDLAAHRGRIEAPLSIEWRGLTIHKCGVWNQGPLFLQQLRLLEGFDLEGLGHNSADYLHAVIETSKLAFADREAYYGDPDFADVPVDTLLSEDYAARRRAEIDPGAASAEFRPGRIDGYPCDPSFLDAADLVGDLAYAAPSGRFGAGEAVADGAGRLPADTVHLDVIDGDGNMVSATPSGGWLQSSPVVPGLGFPLGTRAQMFWLSESHPNGLAPGKRPRTTLTPTIATRGDEPALAFGSPGGDQQDQWTLHFLLNHVVFGMDLQSAIEAPEFQSTHVPESFYPRSYRPAGVVMESRMPPGIVDELRRRGHRVEVVGPWDNGRHLGVSIDRETGIVRGAASPRAPSAYVIGR